MSYLCFLANNFAIDMLMAKDTIAMATESPINMGITLRGGILGVGILEKTKIIHYYYFKGNFNVKSNES